MIYVRNTRFFRWYRTLPLLAIAFMLTLSLCVDFLPIDVVRNVFFPVSHAECIDEAAKRHGVDEHLVAAVIRCESGWDENAQSSAGAVGLMQLMPDTAKELAEKEMVDTDRFDPNNLTDPETNIEYGAALLGYLQDQLSTTDEVIAAYNAGIGSVQTWIYEADGGDFADAITYSETRHYLDHVNEAKRQYTKYYPLGMSVDAEA